MKQYTIEEVYRFVAETHYGSHEYLGYLAGVSYKVIERLYKLATENNLGSYKNAIRRTGMELVDESYNHYPAYPYQFQALVEHYQSLPHKMTIEEAIVLFQMDCSHIVSCFLYEKGGN